MPDRAKIISQLASKAKMDPSSAVKEKDVKLMKKVEPLPTPKDKEAEVEDLLSESEMEDENKKAADDAKEKAIEKVKPENYKNYFEHAYNLKEGIKLHRKSSTRRRKLKNYK